MAEAARATTHPAYEYKPFDYRRKIRLLRILPGDGSQDIHCVLSESDTSASYEALSYCWGSEPATSRPSIILETDDGPRSLSITPNLHLALQHLQLPNSSRHLWIDAVCINQHDNIEKNVQVPRMSQIYRNASCVCVWIGKEESDAQMAIAVIDRLVDSLDRSETVTITQSEASAFMSFIDRPWFSRRWVVQEVALARRATIFCGRREVEWTKLAAAISLLQDRYQNKGIQSHEPGVAGWHRSHASFMTGAPATRLVDATTTMVCKLDDGTVWPLYTLETVVAVLASFECALPQDVLFSVVSLSADPGKDLLLQHSAAADDAHCTHESSPDVEVPEGLRVDYSYAFPQVAKDFISLVLSASKRVDVLCRPWAPNLPDMPSWIAQSSGRAWERTGPRKYARAHADPLVGIANRKYAASGNLGAFGWRFVDGGSATNPAYGCLCVKGCVIDVVVKLTTSVTAAGVIPAVEWAAAAGWTDFDAQLPPVSFWTTLVADRGLGGGPCPPYYEYACQVLFRKCGGSAGGTLDLEALLDDGGLPSSVAEFVRRLECVVWNKRLAVTAGGKVALVPQSTCEGDLICVPYGSSVPVVLHQIERTPLDTSASDSIDCILRGDCYMHGIMYGEAVAKKSLYRRQGVEFRLH